MAVVSGDRTKIKLGPHNVKFGSSGSEVPLGFTIGGVEITYTPSYREIMVDQLGSPVDIRLVSEQFEAKFAIAETSQANFLIALPAASAASGAASAVGINVGRRPGYSIAENASGVLILHPAELDPAVKTRDWTVPIAVPVGPVTISVKPGEEQTIPLVMKAIADPNQEDTYHLFRYGY